MNIAAIAWDIDGTLVDSEPLHQEALLAVCARHGVDISDLADDAFLGVNLFDVWKALKGRFPEGMALRTWMAEIDGYYAGHRHRLRATPGAVATITALHRIGLPQVAVSNSSRVVVNANLQMLGLTSIITWSLSLDDVAPFGKPDPYPYLRAVEHLGLAPARVAAVEDSATGLRSARAAGLTVIAFAPSGEVLASADRTIATLQELPDMLSLPQDA